MKPEEMNLLRKRYYDLKGQKEKIMKVKMELLELEKSSEVQRYLELVGEYQEIRDEGIADIENKDDDFFIRRAINFSKITPTNDIYVYIGAYKYNYETDIIHGASDYLVGRGDVTADYFVYYNLEERYRNSVVVPYQEVNEFEKRHHIIIPKEFFNRDYYFSRLQEEYFKTIVLESEEQAFLKVKKLFKENTKN